MCLTRLVRATRLIYYLLFDIHYVLFIHYLNIIYYYCYYLVLEGSYLFSLTSLRILFASWTLQQAHAKQPCE